MTEENEVYQADAYREENVHLEFNFNDFGRSRNDLANSKNFLNLCTDSKSCFEGQIANKYL